MVFKWNVSIDHEIFSWCGYVNFILFFLNHTPTRRNSCDVQMKCIERPRDFLVLMVCKFYIYFLFMKKIHSPTRRESCGVKMKCIKRPRDFLMVWVANFQFFWIYFFIDSLLHLPRDNLIVSCSFTMGCGYVNFYIHLIFFS